MRRDTRMKNKILNDKLIIYSIIGVTILSIIVFALIIYSKNLSDKMENSTIDFQKVTGMADTKVNDTESASSNIGKTIDEVKKEDEKEDNKSNEKDNNIIDNSKKSNVEKELNNNLNSNTLVQNKTTTATNIESSKEEQKENVKELKFEKPVDGEVVKEFAKDNLVYSETLKEWVTHMGVDFKAEKTSIVKAAEAGVIKSIKNDPRYGLTIVIDHGNNYESVYANLLTSEFVVEGEKVEKGQSIGTVGNTAVFEIADEPHLHFEILKESIPVDPLIYIK